MSHCIACSTVRETTVSSKTTKPFFHSCFLRHLTFFLSVLEPMRRELRLPGVDTVNQRTKRSVSTEKNVEMLMVADQTMYKFYKDGLEEYLLTIANMVVG